MAKTPDILWDVYKYGQKNNKHSFTTYISFIAKEKRTWKAKKGSAIASGKDFDIEFDDWCRLWNYKMLDRGNKPHQFNICRIQEPGPYTIENVYIGNPKDNAEDAIRNGRMITSPMRCRVDGIEFDSITEAMRYFGENHYQFCKNHTVERLGRYRKTITKSP